MEELITTGFKILAVVVVLRILGGLLWSLFQQGGDDSQSQANRAERPYSTQAEFDRIRAYEQSLREQGYNEHDIWERTQEYSAMGREIIANMRTTNKIFEGFGSGRNKMMSGPPRMPLPDRPLTDREWQLIDDLAQEAAERDHRQQGRRPRDVKGRVIR